MAEYMTKDAVISLFEKWSDGYAYIEIPVQDAIRQVSALPPADVRPVVRGKWTDHRTIEHDGEWWCTACGKEITIYMGADRKDRYVFCPNCGAEMEGGDAVGNEKD